MIQHQMDFYLRKMKDDQNTKLIDIDILKDPNTETLPFRYVLASSWCKDKNVLDAATGKGYGAQILMALGAKSVVAVDFEEDTIANNISQYNNKNVNYQVMDLCKEWDDNIYDNMFDTTISIETFEHLPREKLDIYLKNLMNSTKNDGHIFITTPQRQTQRWIYNGGTHLYEYSVEEFVDEITNVFGQSISFFGLQEVRIGDIGQLVSLFKHNIRESHIMCALIKVTK